MTEGIFGVFSHWGEVVITGLLGVIGWVLKTTAGRHFDSMDRISEKISQFGNQLAESKTKLSVIEAHLLAIDDRLDRLEDKSRDE